MEHLKKSPAEKPSHGLTDAETLAATAKAEWKDWLVKGGVAVAILLAVILYRSHRQSNEEQASRMLGEARNAQALQAIIAQYPSTAAARLALLQTAKVQYDSGDYAAAASSYRDFMTRNPKHPMIDVAEVGGIECLEAMGKEAEALTAYSAFATTHTNSFLVPVALFGKARCLQQMQRFDEARAVYEDFIAANPKSAWKKDVEEGLRDLEREALKKPAGNSSQTVQP